MAEDNNEVKDAQMDDPRRKRSFVQNVRNPLADLSPNDAVAKQLRDMAFRSNLANAGVAIFMSPDIGPALLGFLLTGLKIKNQEEEIDNDFVTYLSMVASGEIGAVRYLDDGQSVFDPSRRAMLAYDWRQRFDGLTPAERARVNTVFKDGIETIYSGKPTGLWKGATGPERKMINRYIMSSLFPKFRPPKGTPLFETYTKWQDGKPVEFYADDTYGSKDTKVTSGDKLKKNVTQSVDATLKSPARAVDALTDSIENFIVKHTGAVTPSHSPVINVANGFLEAAAEFKQISAAQMRKVLSPAGLRDITLGTAKHLAQGTVNAFTGVFRGIRQLGRSLGPGIVFEALGTLVGNATLLGMANVGLLDWIGPRDEVKKHVLAFIEGNGTVWNWDPVTSYWRAGTAVNFLWNQQADMGMHGHDPFSTGQFVYDNLSGHDSETGDTVVDNYLIEPLIEGTTDAAGVIGAGAVTATGVGADVVGVGYDGVVSAKEHGFTGAGADDFLTKMRKRFKKRGYFEFNWDMDSPDMEGII